MWDFLPSVPEALRKGPSRYTRMLADLPWLGIPVTVHLRIRRFYCDQKDRERVIFTERLDELFTHVWFALGAETGARLLGELGVEVSGVTLLEHIRRMNLGEWRTPRILSVDYFSFRRGHKWGTVLVDLERHRLVDVLPDHRADTAD